MLYVARLRYRTFAVKRGQRHSPRMCVCVCLYSSQTSHRSQHLTETLSLFFSPSPLCMLHLWKFCPFYFSQQPWQRRSPEWIAAAVRLINVSADISTFFFFFSLLWGRALFDRTATSELLGKPRTESSVHGVHAQPTGRTNKLQKSTFLIQKVKKSSLNIQPVDKQFRIRAESDVTMGVHYSGRSDSVPDSEQLSWAHTQPRTPTCFTSPSILLEIPASSLIGMVYQAKENGQYLRQSQSHILCYKPSVKHVCMDHLQYSIRLFLPLQLVWSGFILYASCVCSWLAYRVKLIKFFSYFSHLSMTQSSP